MIIKDHAKELKFLREFMEFSAKEIFKDKEICNVVLTLKPQKSSYGFCTVQEVYSDDKLNYLEISYNIHYLDRTMKEIFCTLIHEQIHAYCRKVGIKEVSANGRYHNGKFKELCNELGLAVEKHNGIGWNTTGKITEELNNIIEEKFLSKYDSEYLKELFNLKDLFIGGTQKQKSNRNYKKYICPICDQTVRAKASANVICGECSIQMEEA